MTTILLPYVFTAGFNENTISFYTFFYINRNEILSSYQLNSTYTLKIKLNLETEKKKYRCKLLFFNYLKLSRYTCHENS